MQTMRQKAIQSPVSMEHAKVITYLNDGRVIVDEFDSIQIALTYADLIQTKGLMIEDKNVIVTEESVITIIPSNKIDKIEIKIKGQKLQIGVPFKKRTVTDKEHANSLIVTAV